jgi:hypothetical protein
LKYNNAEKMFTSPLETLNGAWDLRGLSFYQAAPMTSFAVAAFCDERRCGRGLDDEGSLQVMAKYSYPDTI